MSRRRLARGVPRGRTPSETRRRDGWVTHRSMSGQAKQHLQHSRTGPQCHRRHDCQLPSHSDLEPSLKCLAIIQSTAWTTDCLVNGSRMKTSFRCRCRNGIYPVFGMLLGIVNGALADPADTATKPAVTHKSQTPSTQAGVASYYGIPYHGRRTASGEIFNMNDLTAAHPNLPFGTKVKVTHVDSQRSVVVRINDRGPFVPGRVIDLSKAAAVELGMIQTGLAPVKIEIVASSSKPR